MPALGGYSGAAIKPIALGALVRLVKACKIPISSIGGINDARSAIERFLAGARTVQICSAVIEKGFKVFKEINDGLSRYMQEKGYDSIDDFVGKSLKHITTIEEVPKEQLYARIDETKCTSCRRCFISCTDASEGAVVEENGKFRVDRNKCVGCGICLSVCPVHAIEMTD
jgi:dihydropyrimidine dehydrogenase (NAD+) subunit PreA